MALEASDSSAAKQTTLLADVALAWASLEKAKAGLQRLESELEHQEWCRARTRSARRRLKWEKTPECSRDREDAIWKEIQTRESSPSRRRLKEDIFERWDVREVSSPTVGCVIPAGSDSDSMMRTCSRPDTPPDLQCPMRPASALSRPLTGLSCLCPSPKGFGEPAPGAVPVSSCGKGSPATLGPARGLWKEASPHLAVPPPATPSPVPGNCRLAWQLEGLKENSLEDKKLQKLKAKILEQRQQHLSQDLPRGRRPSRCSLGEGPQCQQQHPLKRKVCKLAVAAAAAGDNPGFRAVGVKMDPCLPDEERGASSGGQEPPTCTEQKSAPERQPHTKSQGHRGRAARKKRPGSSYVAPVSGKAWKERGSRLFGASAWREGQKLVRKILGPPLQHLKQRSSSEEQAVATLATGNKTEAGKELLATSQVEQRPAGQQGSCLSRQSETEEAGQAGAVAGLSQRWESPPGRNSSLRLLEGQDLENEAEDQLRSRSKKETAGPDPCLDGVKTGHPSEVTNVPARPPLLLGESGGPSASVCGRLSRSSHKSSTSRSPTSRKEGQPASCDRRKGCRRHPYSSEEVHEFMIKKVAERNKRTQEEKRTSKQACEARNRRLQEVYRKQRAALSRKRSRRVEAPRLAEGGSSATLDKQDHGQECMNDRPSDVMEWIRQASCVLLRNEQKESSGSSVKMTRRVKRSRAPGSPLSLAPEGSRLGSPLKLQDLAATSSPLAQCSPPQSPCCLLSRRPLAGLEALMPTGPLGSSLYRNTEDRLRAVQSLAKELSARVERAVAQLQVANRPVDWSNRGWLPGSPALSERPETVLKPEGPWEEFGATPKADAFLKSSRFQNLPTGPQQSREGTSREEGVVTAQATKEVLCSFSAASGAGTAVLPRRSSSEEKPNMVCTRDPKGTQEGVAAVPGFQTERDLTPEKPTASCSRPAPQFSAGRVFANSTADSHVALLHQNSGMENSCEEQPEKLELEQIQEAGLKPGRCCNFSHQEQACGLLLPSVNLTHSKATITEESGDRSEATSQWSEISQFYGGSSTFCRFGLTMAQQYLREEELRARHQNALLRLREKALQENVQAELAWLEHEKRLQGVKGASVTGEKQDRVLTRLKQEQAEIRHLQNVCRAAHQRRKLLLRQQKELLLVQQSTAQLWQQMCQLAGKPQQHQADAVNPTNFKGAVVLEKEESAKVSSPVLDIATCSGDGSSFGPLQGRGYNDLHAKRGEILSQRTEAAEDYPEQKYRLEAQCVELLDVTAENLHARREQATSPPQKADSVGTAADRLVSREEEEEHNEDPGLTKHSKEENHCASSNKGPAPNSSLEHLASAVSSAKLYHFSSETESLQFDSEFHKAHAVLINISGSSPSASDLEAEGTQATDVSLPEEFVFQDQLHDSCGAGAAFPEAPTVPQITISEENTFPLDTRYHTDISCGVSHVDSSVLHSQEKPLNDMPDRSGTYESDVPMLSYNGMPRSNLSWAGGSLSLQAEKSPDRQNAVYLKASALLPCAENSALSKMFLSQGRPQSAAAVASSSAAIHCSENWRKQSPTSANGTAERDDNHGQYRSSPNAEAQPIQSAHEASSKNTDSVNDPVQDTVLLTSVAMQPFPFTPLCSSKDLFVPDSRTSHCTELSADDAPDSSSPEEATAQVAKASMGHGQADASLLCAKTVEEIAKENQNISVTNSQNAKESEMMVLHSSSPKAGKTFQVKSFPLKKVSIELVPEMEDDIQSPVDEVLTYGSADLPSSDASFPNDDLPAPPEDLSEKCDDSSIFTLKDFPSPPQQLLFPETGELEYSMDENVSVKTNNVPSLLENSVPETL